MMKSVSALTRRADLTREQFQHYYEHNHAPLGVRHFPFARYVRNHILGASEIDIDTIMESWAEDLADFSGLLDGPVGAIFAEDEAKFMQRDRIAPAVAQETVLSGGNLTNARDERSVVLIRWREDDAAAAITALRAWANAVAAEQPGVSLDVLQVRPVAVYTGIFPAQALLWLPDYSIAPRPPAVLEVTALRVRRCETPKSELLPYRVGRS